MASDPDLVAKVPQFTQHSCVLLVCADCREDGSEDFTPHYDSEAQARASVRDSGWEEVAEGLICTRCFDKRTCSLTGHAWPEEWQNAYKDPDSQFRICNTCGQFETRAKIS